VLRIDNDDDWVPLHATMVSQLTKFQAKGGNLPHMSSAAAWQNLHSACALEWWSSWGQEVPELQKLALKLVPLLIGSGPAERTWKDVGNVLTKNRNRLRISTCLDLVMVRTWLRRELKVVTDEELEQFKDWETQLLRGASFYDGPVEPADDESCIRRIFEDHVEGWERNAVDGQGTGPRIPMGVVKTNKAAKFRLQEKYKGMYFVDKDTNGDAEYYEAIAAGEAQVDPLPAAQWEHRKIIGLIWENRNGWRLETKLCHSLAGASEHYIPNAAMIIMIKESERNEGVVTFRSDM
jgi:hypothetical protein